MRFGLKRRDEQRETYRQIRFQPFVVESGLRPQPRLAHQHHGETSAGYTFADSTLAWFFLSHVSRHLEHKFRCVLCHNISCAGIFMKPSKWQSLENIWVETGHGGLHTKYGWLSKLLRASRFVHILDQQQSLVCCPQTKAGKMQQETKVFISPRHSKGQGISYTV